MRRALNYRKLFNPARGFMQARNSDGSWASQDAGWTEGDQWVYLFAPLHDIAGVMQLLGGADAFNTRLDEHFGAITTITTTSQPPLWFCMTSVASRGRPRPRVRQIARDAYSNSPNGVLGNEDCGQMSAWYIFTALGFYPVNPAAAQYMIGSPMFARAPCIFPTAGTSKSRRTAIRPTILTSSPLG